MSSYAGDAIGSTVESSPSVGLALVDSMAARRIKVFARYVEGFRKILHPAGFGLPAAMPNRGPDLLFRRSVSRRI
ncbi:MAG: hypothetical protein KGK16_10415 [Bradyrhizobium sp.]|uniref:hypothetical protein n=1 Tax=Bradyrhizobium sp. TaxID=376 RepID=UPI00239353BF|nr:hypothetical protein [Bradyrhizobium sp.]MDE2331178.1 hypothetical protein [Bradyrhizobium sp.]MDE2602974.1 hypothetical protein [Bradyrhizobium sp.]